MNKTIPVLRSGPVRRRCWRAAVSAVLATLLASLTAAGGRADGRCFTEDIDRTYDIIRGNGDGKQYILGFDKLLTSVLIRFFPDGHVCGINEILRIEGTNAADGQIQIAILDLKTNPPDPGATATDGNDQSASWKQQKYIDTLLRSKLSGTARKQLTAELILWEGRLQGNDGKSFDFYLKRTRPNVSKPVPTGGDDCGDGGCVELSIIVLVKKGAVASFLQDARLLPISKLKATEANECGDFPDLKSDELCYYAETWPLEESNVVKALQRKAYVSHAKRVGAGAGTDVETFFLESRTLLTSNQRLNIPVAASLFQDALARYFEGTGLFVSDPAARQNSLFWEFKGRRFQFEKKPNPSPAERSEWWKVRLQIAVTEVGAGAYVFLCALPETRIASWALSTVPNDEKFVTELTNDDRFLDLQGRLIVAITKFLPATKE